MSSWVDLSSDQLCYIPCNFCNIVLAVSVPCSNLFDIVTVRCGHCTNLWSVNMAAALRYSFSWQDIQAYVQGPKYMNQDHRVDVCSSSKFGNKPMGSMRPSAQVPNANPTDQERVISRPPPEKRQRVPSAYNQFIKEEIQRIKANNPDISHREAFSTAAKNWAHFPHIHFGLMLEGNNQAAKTTEKHRMSTRAGLQN